MNHPYHVHILFRPAWIPVILVGWSLRIAVLVWLAVTLGPLVPGYGSYLFLMGLVTRSYHEDVQGFRERKPVAVESRFAQTIGALALAQLTAGFLGPLALVFCACHQCYHQLMLIPHKYEKNQ